VTICIRLKCLPASFEVGLKYLNIEPMANGVGCGKDAIIPAPVIAIPGLLKVSGEI
jgi:hypothetical protein